MPENVRYVDLETESARRLVPMSLELDVRDDSSGVTLHAHGDLDISTVEAFRVAAGGLLELGQSLRLDLSDLAFIDSTGINGLVEVARIGEARLTISDELRPEVRRVLSLTGIIRTLPLRPRADG